jgi:prevent-host-death family protein
MKTIPASKLNPRADVLHTMAHGERAVITRAGRPVAVLINIEGYDDEDLALVQSANFWRLIDSRRKEKTIPFEEFMARLEAKKAKSSSASGAKRQKVKSARSRAKAGNR